MSWWDKFKKSLTSSQRYPLALGFTSYQGEVSEAQALALSVVYRCVDLISNSVAQLPIELLSNDKKRINNDLAYMLNCEPDSVLDRFSFLKVITASVLLTGNGFAIIERDLSNRVKALRYVPSEQVQIQAEINELGLRTAIYYIVNGKAYESENVLHFKNYSYDGVVGVSTLSHAAGSLELARDSESSARGFFRNGCNLGGILSAEGMLNQKQKEDLKDSWERAFSAATGKLNGVAVLEGGLTYQPITVNPVDAQLLETRKYSVVDLCRFFGVSPTKAFDLSKSSYSTIEAESLAFLTDTLQPILSKMECEFARKVLTRDERRQMTVKFNTSVLLRTDKSSLASYFNTLFQIGVLSQNEIRGTLDLPPIADGDRHFVQLNMAGADTSTEIKSETKAKENGEE